MSANVPSNSPNNKLPVLIAGPTGVGKTDFAVALAQRVGGEIVCADAFQIYSGFRLLTARPSLEEQAGVPHHLFGFVPPSEPWDVARYLECLLRICGEIVERGRVPILVGGTGLYFQAFLYGLDPVPPSDPSLRERLERLELPEALEALARLDPGAPALLDVKNPRRVVRALEIVTLSGRPLCDFRSAWSRPPRPCRAMRLERDRAELHARQAENIRRMLSGGVLDEVDEVRRSGVGDTAARALGYEEFCAVLDRRLELPEAVRRLEAATRQYARRQMTWFRRHSIFELHSLSVG